MHASTLISPLWISAWLMVAMMENMSLGLPDLRDNTRQQIKVPAGQDAVLTCIAKNLENNTLIWKRVRQGRTEVVSAGELRVTSDSRFSILHTEGGNQWILTITQARVSDSGQYVCEVNSSPTIRVFQLLTVLPMNALPSMTPFALTHNFTECCVLRNVPDACLGFCNLQNIVLGVTGGTSSHDCENHLSSIALCMADGRNHEPCCIKERIPEACREVCRGEYTMQNVSVLHHYACSHYSSATLACIAQGVEVLPSPPQEVAVEPVSDREIVVKWKLPKDNSESVTNFILNVTELKTFDEMDSSIDVDGPMGEEEEYFPGDGIMMPAKPKIERQGRTENFVEKYTEIKLNGTDTSTVLKELKPYTMYELYLISVNVHGSSLPTYRLRTLTLMPAIQQQPKNVSTSSTVVQTLLDLPDVKGCCIKKGLPLENCVDRFCDPRQTDSINLTDMMICAPWVAITIPCLTQGRDHTPCCVQRGLPSLCLNLCHGNITRIDYQYFQCLPYMAIYANCLMEGYGVVASPPKDLLVKYLSSSWAVLQWEPPEKLADTVTLYNLHFRLLAGDDQGDGFYTVVGNARSPYLLNDLRPATNYEVYVRAVNQYGVSQASSRLLFRSNRILSDVEDSESQQSSGYNMTECCVQSSVNSDCLPLCNLRARLADVKDLLPKCLEEVHRVMRCGTAGRNHTPCCEKRHVNAPCLEMCAGFLGKVATAASSTCIADLIPIVECMKEGMDILPGPITDLQVVNVNTSAVHLEWEAPNDGSNVTFYEIHYDIKKDNSIEKVVLLNETSYYLTDLVSNKLYEIYVVSVNDHGSSIASSMVHLNLSMDNEGKINIGTPSPPEGITIRQKNTTSLTVVWLPPAFTHPLDHLRYKLYYHMKNQSVPNSLTTTSLGVQVNDLFPGTEYEMYVTALTDRGESPPANTISVWTENAYPAYVEVPGIHPANQVVEGTNMTVLCVAMGTPTPLISVFVRGALYAQDVTRHMLTVVHNVTREMTSVTCHAQNGQGAGWQATRRLRVSYAPNVEVAKETEAVLGKNALLMCSVSSYPEPQMVWWRDIKGEHQIVNGDRHHISTVQEETGDYSMHLSIMNVTTQDAGSYYCHAKNPIGTVMESTILQVTIVANEGPSSIRDCCIEQHVAEECMDACNYEVNMDTLISSSKCIPEIHKLMYCAADGSNHKRCCLGWGVPPRCLGWCQGKAIHHGAMCVLVWSKQIMSCFQEGRGHQHLLPGPPQNLHVQQLSETEAMLSWDPPLKNSNTVEYYRVAWKKTSPGPIIKYHNETHEHYLMMDNINGGAVYEFTVRAINRRGSSLPSSPFKSEMNGHPNSLYSIQAESSKNEMGLVIGLVIAILVFGFVGSIVFLAYRGHSLTKLPAGVSFENPSYMKDGTSDTVQIANSADMNNGCGNVDTNGWKHETLQVCEIPTSEIGSSSGTSRYEELHDDQLPGSGYKQFDFKKS